MGEKPPGPEAAADASPGTSPGHSPAGTPAAAAGVVGDAGPAPDEATAATPAPAAARDTAGKKPRRARKARRSKERGGPGSDAGASAGQPAQPPASHHGDLAGDLAGDLGSDPGSEGIGNDDHPTPADPPPGAAEPKPAHAGSEGITSERAAPGPQFLDEQDGVRLLTLFDTGRDLPARLRAGWLRELEEDDPRLVPLLRGLLARADDAAFDVVQVVGALVAAPAGIEDAVVLPAAPDSPEGAPVQPPEAAPMEASTIAAGTGGGPGSDASLAPGMPEPTAEPTTEPAVEPVDEPVAELVVDPAADPATERPFELGAAAAAPADSPADEPEPASPAEPLVEPPYAEASTADDAAGPYLEAPALATGMQLGPWLLVGPMTATDARVQQWRVRRADEAPPGRELALLVPHQWRPRPELCAWLRHAAAGPLSLVHPHIARFVEVGITDDGTPWMAAELAEGQTVNHWVRDRAAALHERHQLFERVLEAAAFAHRRLVLHGQIHPAQILVLPGGQVRWLNFGLSDLLRVLGTPAVPAVAGTALPPPRAYAAPELAAGTAPGSLAGDVHALGLVLFEVLAGVSPWHSRPAGMAAGTVVQATGISRWPRPSDVVGTSKLRRALAGDLDAIVAKATATAADARYSSAAELLTDMQHAGEARPVAARDGGLLYQAGCLARRHPAWASAVGVLAVVLSTALAGLTWLAWTWTQERSQALAAHHSAEAVGRWLQELLRASVEPGAQPGGAERDWPSLLAQAEAVARASLKQQPAGLAAALAVLGRHHVERGAFAEGRNLLAEAMPGLASPVEQQEAACDEAWAQARQGDKAGEAEQRLRRIAENTGVRPLTRVLCLARLADLDRRAGRSLDAYLATLQAWQLWDGTGEKPEPLALLLSRPMGQQAAALGRFHESQLWFEWALKHAETLRQERTPLGLQLREEWGEVSLAAGDAERAVKLADANLAALAGSPMPAEVEPDTAPPALMFFAAAEPRVELYRMAEARARLEYAIVLAEARGDAPMRQQARCLMALASLRERDAEAAQRWLKAATPDAAAGATPVQGSPRPPAPAMGAAATPREGAAAPAGALGAEQTCRAVQLELALLQGRHTEVTREADRLLASATELTPRLQATVMRLRAESLLAARQLDRALNAALQALQKARSMHQSDVDEMKAPPSFRSGQAALVLTEAYRAGGDLDNAKRTLAYAAQQLAGTLPEQHPWRRRAEVVKAQLSDPAQTKP
ncbi:MAG: protein kinase [Rubrivivax sp.]|nr:protein kinase [Rubrivivax sp.]